MALVALVVPASAGHQPDHQLVSLEDSNFEIDRDANLKSDHAAPYFDWADVANGRQADKDSGREDDSFGNGTKEDTAVPSIVSGSIPPNKSDLLNFGVHLEKAAGGNFLHVFWHRVQEPTGTTNMDFEFNQSATLSSNGVTPIRTDGDMLIQYDLAQGGVNPKLWVSKWVATGAKSNCEAANSTPCWGKRQALSDVGEATGSINSSAIPAADAAGLGPISARTFGEASIDFDFLAGGTGCLSFGSAYLKSRASDSFTAALKDFIAPKSVDVTNCGSLKILKQDPDGNPLAGAKFKVYKDDGDGVFTPGTDVQVGQDGNNNSTAAAECTTTSDGTGDCTFNNLLKGLKFWVHETQVPPGFEIVSANPALVEITGTNVHTVIVVNRPAVGDLTVVKRDDASPAAFMNGITFRLSGNSAGGVAVNVTCVTGVSNSSGTQVPAAGTCSFLQIPHGTAYTLAEEVPLPAGYGPDPGFPKTGVTISNTPVTVNATNPRLHRVVVIVCHEGDDTLFSRDVVNGPSTKASIGSVPSALAAKGVTQKDLCDLGGASFGGAGHGDQSLTAKINQH